MQVLFGPHSQTMPALQVTQPGLQVAVHLPFWQVFDI
jgi:hypothetical protein